MHPAAAGDGSIECHGAFRLHHLSWRGESTETASSVGMRRNGKSGRNGTLPLPSPSDASQSGLHHRYFGSIHTRHHSTALADLEVHGCACSFGGVGSARARCALICPGAAVPASKLVTVIRVSSPAGGRGSEGDVWLIARYRAVFRIAARRNHRRARAHDANGRERFIPGVPDPRTAARPCRLPRSPFVPPPGRSRFRGRVRRLFVGDSSELVYRA